MKAALLRWVVWPIGIFLAVVTGLYLVVLAINWRDEPPSAAAKELAAALKTKPALPSAQNAYFPLLALDVERNADPHQTGEREVKRAASLPPFPEAPYQKQYRIDPSFQRDLSLPAICRKDNARCWPSPWQDRALTKRLLTENSLLLQRYQHVLTYPGIKLPFLNTNTPVIDVKHVWNGQWLRLLQALTLLQAGQLDVAAEQLAADMRFYRRAFSASDILLHKMMFDSCLLRQMKAIAAFAHERPALLRNQRLSDAIASPLTPQERSIALALAGEWRFIDQTLQAQANEGARHNAGMFTDEFRPWDALFLPFFKPRATSNRIAADYMAWLRHVDVPIERMPDALRHPIDVTDANTNSGPFAFAYNPFGRIIASVAKPNLNEFAAKTSDLEVYRRALLLTAKLHARDVLAEAVAHAPEVEAVDLRNPYTGKPFQWDAQSSALVFDGLAKRNGTTTHYVVPY